MSFRHRKTFSLTATDLSPLTVAEVKQLWSFHSWGSIMVPDTRHHLWRSWGFCPRHSWAYAVSEIEVYGGLPFAAAILYQDLLTRASAHVARTKRWPWPVAAAGLQPSDSCFTCDYRETAGDAGEPGDEARLARILPLSRTLRLLRATEGIWRARACPRCLGGSGLVCRPHLLAGADVPDRTALAVALKELAGRVQRYVKSHTVGGPKITDESEAAWIEALGWFVGWWFPDAVLESEGWPVPGRNSHP